VTAQPPPPRPEPPGGEPVHLHGEIFDLRGARISVYRDYDAVRIDAGANEYMLDRATAYRLTAVIMSACIAAMDWEDPAADPPGPAGPPYPGEGITGMHWDNLGSRGSDD
jgi:hypothetical protein